MDGSIAYINEFVGLRSKLYSYVLEVQAHINSQIDKHVSLVEEHHKCKGVKHCVIENKLTTQLYKSVLFSRQKFKVKQNTFRSYKHQLYTETIQKNGLSHDDDKCFIHDNNVTTYTIGHYKINQK